jgi:hypothetical protein
MSEGTKIVYLQFSDAGSNDDSVKGMHSIWSVVWTDVNNLKKAVRIDAVPSLC